MLPSVSKCLTLFLLSLGFRTLTIFLLLARPQVSAKKRKEEAVSSEGVPQAATPVGLVQKEVADPCLPTPEQATHEPAVIVTDVVPEAPAPSDPAGGAQAQGLPIARVDAALPAKLPTPIPP